MAIHSPPPRRDGGAGIDSNSQLLMLPFNRQKRFHTLSAETFPHTVCEKCKGPVRIMACIEESLPRERSECSGYPVVIEKILAHLNAKEGEQESHPNRLPPSRALPQFPGWDQGLSD